MFVENLAPFFADWGEVVTLAGGAVTAIFDNEFQAALGISGTGPQLVVKSADVTALTVGAAAVVRTVNYIVRGIEPDGTGITLLRLERA